MHSWVPYATVQLFTHRLAFWRSWCGVFVYACAWVYLKVLSRKKNHPARTLQHGAQNIDATQQPHADAGILHQIRTCCTVANGMCINGVLFRLLCSSLLLYSLHSSSVSFRLGNDQIKLINIKALSDDIIWWSEIDALVKRTLATWPPSFRMDPHRRDVRVPHRLYTVCKIGRVRETRDAQRNADGHWGHNLSVSLGIWFYFWECECVKQISFRMSHVLCKKYIICIEIFCKKTSGSLAPVLTSYFECAHERMSTCNMHSQLVRTRSVRVWTTPCTTYKSNIVCAQTQIHTHATRTTGRCIHLQSLVIARVRLFIVEFIACAFLFG